MIIQYLIALAVGVLVGLAVIGAGHMIEAFREGRQQPRCGCGRRGIEYRGGQTPGVKAGRIRDGG